MSDPGDLRESKLLRIEPKCDKRLGIFLLPPFPIIHATISHKALLYGIRCTCDPQNRIAHSPPGRAFNWEMRADAIDGDSVALLGGYICR
jgi:hypothetical protein